MTRFKFFSFLMIILLFLVVGGIGIKVTASDEADKETVKESQRPEPKETLVITPFSTSEQNQTSLLPTSLVCNVTYSVSTNQIAGQGTHFTIKRIFTPFDSSQCGGTLNFSCGEQVTQYNSGCNNDGCQLTVVYQFYVPPYNELSPPSSCNITTADVFRIIQRTIIKSRPRWRIKKPKECCNGGVIG
jgi:hypothetical protein